MDTEAVRTILWIVAACLMAGGATGVLLAVLLGKPRDEHATEPVRALRPAGTAAVAGLAAALPKPVDETRLAARKGAYRLGAIVFVGLAVLTALEFVIATAGGGSVILLFLVALVKAGLIVQYYMHLRTVWGEEAHE